MMLQLSAVHISARSEAGRRERLEEIKAYCVAPVECEEEEDVDWVARGVEMKMNAMKC